MDLEGRLALKILEGHALEAARTLERLPAAAVADFLAASPAAAAARVLACMQPQGAAAVLAGLATGRAARVLDELPVDAGGLRLRHLEAARREAILEALPARRARAYRALLRFPERSAGALMDPDVLALSQDLSVAEALERVREPASHAHYNLYVVDRGQRLVGVVNLRELLVAGRSDSLAGIMRSPVHRIAAHADRRAILAHPGWREVHALPVVDDGGTYLGAILYRTLRRLEEELHGAPLEAGATARALGELFRTGASAMLEAVAASSPEPGPMAGRSDDAS